MTSLAQGHKLPHLSRGGKWRGLASRTRALQRQTGFPSRSSWLLLMNGLRLLRWPLRFCLDRACCSSQASHCSMSFSEGEGVSLSSVLKTREKAHTGPFCVVCLSRYLQKVGWEAESLRRCHSPMNLSCGHSALPSGGPCWADKTCPPQMAVSSILYPVFTMGFYAWCPTPTDPVSFAGQKYYPHLTDEETGVEKVKQGLRSHG